MNSMPTVQFDKQYAKKFAIRPASNRYVESNLRGIFEISDGVTPESFWPWRYLPVMWIDPTLGDGVVITKGTIVAAVDGKTTQAQSIDTSSLIPDVSGSIALGEDATTAALDFITAVAEDSPFGYDNLIAGLLVPCNGGTETTTLYTTLDETVGTMKDKTAYAAAGDVFTNPANVPIGVVTMDIYQDIRGKYLNYGLWDTWGILCDKYVYVPFADDSVAASAIAGAFRVEATTADGSIYAAVRNQYAFMYRPAGVAMTSGLLVKSDRYGKFIPVTSTTVTSQTVGKIIVMDSRYPKGGLEKVQTYPGTETTGTDTGGLPAELYTFVKACLTVALAATPTQTQVLDEVRHGAFGIAKINLHIA